MRWIVILIIFFLALAGVAIFVVNWAEIAPEIFVPLVPSAVSVTFTLVLFIGFLVTLAKLFRLAWARIPTAVIDSTQMDKVLAALISLGIFPAIAKYAWATFQAIMRLFPELMRMLASFDLQTDCSGRWGTDSIHRCASGLANELGRTTNQFASRIMDALNLEGFPLEDFVWFLISTVVLVQLIASLRQRLVLDEVVTWLTSRIGGSVQALALFRQ
jgi:hypothetical protein